MKRKIAMVSVNAAPLIDPEGMNNDQECVYLAQVTHHLAQMGYQVDIFTNSANQGLSELYQGNENIHMIYIPVEASDEDLVSSLQDVSMFMTEVFNKQDKSYDLMHANAWTSGFVAAEIKAALGTPFVMRFSTLGRENRNPCSDLPLEIVGRVMKDADGILAETSEDGADLISLYDADPTRVTQIPCREHQGYSWQNMANMLADYYENVLAIRRVEIIDFDSFPLVVGQQDSRLALLEHTFETSIRSLQHTKETLEKSILEAASLIFDCVDRGGKIMIAADDSSAAFAQYMTAELAGRVGLPVVSLAAETNFLNTWSTTAASERTLSAQVQALGRPGDLLLGICTGGRSANLTEAFRLSREHQIHCLGLMGSEAGDLLFLPDVALVIPSANVQHIKQAQMLVLHVLCELVEEHNNALEPISAENPYNTTHVMNMLKILAE